MNKVYIHTEFIKLQQVLKLAGLIDQGSDVKYFLSQGKVLDKFCMNIHLVHIVLLLLHP